MKLQAHKKTEADKAKVLRQQGNTPAICYGPDLETAIAMVIPSPVLTKAVRDAGRSTIIELSIDGEEHEVLIKDVAYHPVTDLIDHVDFYAIKRGQELEVEVELVFVGHAPAEKAGLIVHKTTNELQVRCMPRNLVNHIDVDLSGLNEAGDSITVADIQKQVGENLTILDDEDNVIVIRSEEHTSELQSHHDLVCRLLLEKKNKGHPHPPMLVVNNYCPPL